MALDPSSFWRLDRTAEALDALLLRSKIPLPPGATFAAYIREGRDLGWLKRLPQGLACEAGFRVLSTSSLMDRLAVERGPCLIFDHNSDTTLAVVFDSATRARLVRPDGTDERVSRRHVMDLFLSTRSQTGLDAIFDGLAGGARAARALSANEFDMTRSTLVSFGPDAAHSFVQQLSYEGAFRALGGHVALVGIQGLLSLGALWTLGSSIAEGHVNFGVLAAWTALTLTGAPIQYMASRALRGFSIALGARMKRRVLEGAFKIEEREIRRHGYGALLARANETSIVERIDMINVFGALNSVNQLVISAFLFERSSSFRPLLGVLLASVVALGLLGQRIFQSFAETYRLRLRLTDDLVDKLLGHRTRAMQQPATQYHVTEDADLAAYSRSAAHTDNLRTLAGAFPRLWLIAAGSVVLGAFLVRDTPASLAWAAIGLVFASQAFGALAGWLQIVATWRTSYGGVRQLIEAGRIREKAPRRSDVQVGEKAVPVVMSATSLGFAYRSGGFPILNEASLRVHRGEKVLVTGPSGGGKTTLFKLIGGELRPTGGVVLVGGADANLVSGEEWRERVASAPQFHENYVFAQPVAFNLDPRGAFAEASPEVRAICEELGLDRVIGRMPQGYAQLLGETGWQLSHGERSRLFIARALLQGAELFLFDESFGALDPETQLRALECVRRRARTLMVIAHA